eukprot:2569910-Prymnesium_polylepis.1
MPHAPHAICLTRQAPLSESPCSARPRTPSPASAPAQSLSAARQPRLEVVQLLLEILLGRADFGDATHLVGHVTNVAVTRSSSPSAAQLG